MREFARVARAVRLKFGAALRNFAAAARIPAIMRCYIVLYYISCYMLYHIMLHCITISYTCTYIYIYIYIHIMRLEEMSGGFAERLLERIA